VLEALLQKYQDEAVTNLDDPRILQIMFTTFGTEIAASESHILSPCSARSALIVVGGLPEC
jgi:hypothetical protein